jgi:ABC-type transport system involved in multi-copper enzyme maturation permease subunit
MNVLIVAGLTLRELARRRLFVVLVLVTLVTIGLSDWGLHALYSLTLGRHASETPGEVSFVGSQELVLFLFMFSAVVALTAAAAGAPALAGEIEAGTLPAFLARPLGRAELVVGKWLGLAGVLVVYVGATTALELGVVLSVVGYRAPHPFFALLALLLEALAVMSAALFLGSRLSAMAAGVVTAAAFFVSWGAGVTGGVGNVLNNQRLIRAAALMHLVVPTDGLWRGAVYYLEPSGAIAQALIQAAGHGLAADPFFVTVRQSAAFFVWAAAWTAAMVAFAIWSFARREV